MDILKNSQSAPNINETQQVSPAASESPFHILDSITDAFTAFDHEWRFVYVNPQAEHLLSAVSADLVGKNLWEDFPETRGTLTEREYRRAVSERTPVIFEQFYTPLNIWFEVRAFPTPDGLSVFFHDDTQRIERERRERFLADLAEQARGMTDPDEVIAHAVHSLGQFLGLSRCMFADIDMDTDTCSIRLDYCADASVQSIAGIFPLSAFGSFIVEEFQNGRAVAVDDVRLDGLRVPEESIRTYEGIGVLAHVTAPVVHSSRLVSCIGAHSSVPRHWKPEEVALLQTVVERTWLMVEVIRQERALGHEAEVTARILRSITDAFFTLDREWRFIHINAQAERLMTKPASQIMGQIFWDVFPNLLGTQFEQEYRRAVAEGVSVTFQIFYAPLNAWLDVRAYPSEDSFSVFFNNITEKKNEEKKRDEREERERLLAGLAERARALTDPDAVIADALRSVGEFLQVSRCVFVDIDFAADACIAHLNYRADSSVTSMAGVFPISAFGAVVVAAYRAGQAVAVEDVRNDPDQVPSENVAAYDALSIRAHVGVPVVHSDRLVSCIGAHSSVPRHWKPEEVELLRTVVERTWLTVEVARQAQALAREAEQRREAAERTERVLDALSDAFFTLDRDFQFTFVNRQAEALWKMTRADLVGRSIWEVFPDSVGGVLYHQYRRVMAEGTSESVEEFDTLLKAWLEVRAFPSDDGISVFFQDVTVRKRLEAEQVKMAEREHKIAQQLQAALTPAVPENIPGMALTKYYNAALDEAGVGGDFYDVFPVSKDCTALVVGDLSGKGLAAATQVATVRNMLRYALYRARTIVGALEGLNALLAEQGLLTGFCTLFVGAYDSSKSTLTYVNCGQEPALLRRVTGSVEHLAPTGSVLGSFRYAGFEEQTVKLEAGDILAVFTDGLTEVGKSRADMIGVEGVADILAEIIIPAELDTAQTRAERLALSLIQGIDKAGAGGVTRDDVCLLVGIAE